jgi:subtilisin family serine protease
MAAPFVSGLAALLLADDPLLDPNDVRRIIRFSSEDLGSSGFDPYFGYGRIDAYNALVYSTTGSLDSVSGNSATGGSPGVSTTDLDKEDPEQETSVSIKGEDVGEVVSMYEVQRKNRATFTGYSPVEDTRPDRISLE